jgi:hypothetical protein
MTLITKPTKIHLEGNGTLTLRTSDYVTQGGEGAIYRKGGHIIKLYLDPKKMQKDDMVGKVRLLSSTLQHPSIVAPRGIVTNEYHQPIGFYMPFVTGESYPRLFTNSWRNQHQFGLKETTTLAASMHEVVSFTHQQQALMVDANELNWLADVRNPKQPVPYIIDVDSWAIGRWPASVIMPSIRDWHSQKLSPLTDWFAWGVVTFLLYTGIHPYRGGLDGYKPNELERRMKDNASVFRPNVRLNGAVRDFSLIPSPLLSWYEATFTHGDRAVPPSPLKTGAINTKLARTLRMVTTTTGNLIFEKLLAIVGDPITSVWPCGVARTASGVLYDVVSKQRIGSTTASQMAVVRRNNGWLLAEEIGGQWQWSFLNHQGSRYELNLPLEVATVFRNGERLFAITETELVELVLLPFAKPVLTIGKRWSVMGNATEWFRGIGVSDVLGNMHLVAPFGDDSVAIVRVPELDGTRVVNAIAGTRFAEVVTVDAVGQYQAFRFAFDARWRDYTLFKALCDSAELNTTILPKGVTVTIREDGELTIAVPHKQEERVVSDKDILATMRLSHIGDRVTYRHQGELWSLRMR